jgi:simple sugar transport system permease protein
MVTVIQALVILFTGALDNMIRMPIERMILASRRRRAANGASQPNPAE